MKFGSISVWSHCSNDTELKVRLVHEMFYMLVYAKSTDTEKPIVQHEMNINMLIKSKK